jgi:hypothetical protein
MARNFDFSVGRSSPFRLPMPFLVPPNGILPMGVPLIGQNQGQGSSSADSYGQGGDMSNDPFVLMAMLASRANDPMKQMNDMMQMAQMIGQIVGQLFQQMQSLMQNGVLGNQGLGSNFGGNSGNQGFGNDLGQLGNRQFDHTRRADAGHDHRHAERPREDTRAARVPETDTRVGDGTGGRVTESQGTVAAIRRGAITPELRRQLEHAGRATGLNVEVTSGGQPSHGPNRTGSHRHDHGNAADLVLRDARTGRMLDMRNPADAERMAKFTEEAVRAGATGVGAGLGYMGPHTIHIGGGRAATWGGASWIRGAWERGMARR